MTPAFAHALVFCRLATRAVIVPSPLSDWYTKWNSSKLSQMSAPEAFTVKVPPEWDALPAMPTLPMSRFCHGDGSEPPGKSRAWGTICFAWLGLDHDSFATAPPPFS